MNIRTITETDIPELRRIHEKHFAHEFTFPDFLKGYYCTFILENENGIITAGGVRPIPEVVTLTDKDKLHLDRRHALSLVLEISEYYCKKAGFDGVHAFVQDPMWIRRLTKHGFHPTKGQALVMEL